MNKLVSYSKYIVSALVLIGLILLFFDCGVYKSGNIRMLESSGYEMIFGKKNQGTAILGFNTTGLIMLISMLASCIVLYFEKQIGKYTRLLSIILLLISSVLFLTLPSSVVHLSLEKANLFSSLPCIIIGANLLFVTALFSIFVLIVKED